MVKVEVRGRSAVQRVRQKIRLQSASELRALLGARVYLKIAPELYRNTSIKTLDLQAISLDDIKGICKYST
jgi:hypothetical protein